MVLTLDELAARLGGEIRGDRGCRISGIASLKSARSGDITFLSNSRYRHQLGTTSASAVILSAHDAEDCPINALVVDNPYLCYARVAQMLFPPREIAGGIHPTAVIDKAAKIDPSVSVGPHCVIGPEVDIAANVVIGPGCYIEGNTIIGAGSHLVGQVVVRGNTRIGSNAIIHAGVVIGSDGFGFANDHGQWIKIPQLGGVSIGADVEIGANTTIDRGALDDTVIEDGVKLDNQIQIAHNVRVGANTAIAGCSAIAGSTTVGKRCAIGGGVGIVGHLEIVDDVQITATTFVSQSITRAGVYSSGMPLEENAHWRKNFARIKQLDELARRVKELEKLLVEKNDNGQSG